MSEFNQVQQQFLNMVACFIHNKRFSAQGDLCPMGELAKLAAQHKLSAAVFETLRESIPEELGTQVWDNWKRSTVREVYVQMGRTEAFLKLYRELADAGVRALVVKGVVCRSLYAKPDYRPSGDEDLLVAAEDAGACDRFLVNRGFVREAFDLAVLPQEVGYRQPGTGLYLEVHFALFEEESQVFGPLNAYFADAFETAECVTVGDCKVWTLDPTKHFLYLILHSYKHFLYSGFGIRQVCDMVRMAEAWQQRLDWEYLAKVLTELGLWRFYTGVLQIGARYLGMEADVTQRILESGRTIGADTAWLQADVEDLLADLLLAGIYGSSTDERVHSANITLAAVHKESGLIRSLFPNRAYMERKYPFVEKQVALLPVAWLMRIGSYLCHRSAGGAEGNEGSIQIGMKRVELLRRYGVIE